jgi:hypothetical protein
LSEDTSKDSSAVTGTRQSIIETLINKIKPVNPNIDLRKGRPFFSMLIPPGSALIADI